MVPFSILYMVLHKFMRGIQELFLYMALSMSALLLRRSRRSLTGLLEFCAKSTSKLSLRNVLKDKIYVHSVKISLKITNRKGFVKSFCGKVKKKLFGVFSSPTA